MATGCPASAQATSVSTISSSQTSGLFGLTMPITIGLRGERIRAARGDRGKRDRVARLRTAGAVDDERPVAPAKDRVVHLEVPTVVVEVLRLGSAALQQRQRVRGVRQLDQLDVVGDRPVPPAALAIMRERRTADRRVDQAASADGQPSFGVSSGDLERRRR